MTAWSPCWARRVCSQEDGHKGKDTQTTLGWLALPLKVTLSLSLAPEGAFEKQGRPGPQGWRKQAPPLANRSHPRTWPVPSSALAYSTDTPISEAPALLQLPEARAAPRLVTNPLPRSDSPRSRAWGRDLGTRFIKKVPLGSPSEGGRERLSPRVKPSLERQQSREYS